MTKLSAQAISQFKQIYSEEFGEEIFDSDAQQSATEVLRLYTLLYATSPPK